MVGGGGAIGTTTTSIMPYAIGDSGFYQGSFYLTSGLGTDFVTYNGGSVQLLTTYASTIANSTTSANNVKITDSAWSFTGVFLDQLADLQQRRCHRGQRGRVERGRDRHLDGHQRRDHGHYDHAGYLGRRQRRQLWRPIHQQRHLRR